MDNSIRVFSGRTINTEDIEMIIWVRKRYPKLSRTELTSTICEMIGWTTPAGAPTRIMNMNTVILTHGMRWKDTIT